MLYIVGTVSAEFRAYCQAHQLSYRRFTPTPANADSHSSFFIDMTSRAAAIASLEALPAPLDVTALLVCGYEQFVLPGAWLAEHLDLPFTSAAAAQAATDKISMRHAFQAADSSITPAFRQVQSWSDIETFVAEHGFPVMLKPANLMKSLFISRNDSLEQLRDNYTAMQAALPALYARYRLGQPRMLIERCLTGSMHTVAGFVDATGRITLADGVVDCRTAHDIGVADSYLFSRTLPSNLDDTAQGRLRTVAETGLRALGLRSTPAHIELMFTEDGPQIIEIGARLGGYRPLMYAQASGQDLYAAAIELAYGRPVVLPAGRTRAYGVVELFPETDGRLLAVHGMEAATALPEVVRCSLKAQPNELVGRASSGFRASAIVQLQAVNRDSLEAAITQLRHTVSFDVEA